MSDLQVILISLAVVVIFAAKVWYIERYIK